MVVASPSPSPSPSPTVVVPPVVLQSGPADTGSQRTQAELCSCAADGVSNGYATGRRGCARHGAPTNLVMHCYVSVLAARAAAVAAVTLLKAPHPAPALTPPDPLRLIHLTRSLPAPGPALLLQVVGGVQCTASWVNPSPSMPGAAWKRCSNSSE